MSVTKHDQTMILAHMYDKSRYNDGNCIPIVLHPITLHVCVFFSRSHWWRSRTPSFLLFIYVNVSVYGLNKHFYFKTFFETIIIIKAWSFKLCTMINILWISYFHTGFGDFSRISRSLQHLKMRNVFDRTGQWTRTLIYSWSNVAVKRMNVVGVGHMNVVGVARLSLQTIFLHSLQVHRATFN